jgi:hypothetical protein
VHWIKPERNPLESRENPSEELVDVAPGLIASKPGVIPKCSRNLRRVKLRRLVDGAVDETDRKIDDPQDVQEPWS